MSRLAFYLFILTGGGYFNKVGFTVMIMVGYLIWILVRSIFRYLDVRGCASVYVVVGKGSRFSVRGDKGYRENEYSIFENFIYLFIKIDVCVRYK